ncbi:MAG: ABC transporter permease [Candidatus Omnitrophota bacterium]|nr:ABC transporter permease [Candidatus Omnitrophota bacterium]
MFIRVLKKSFMRQKRNKVLAIACLALGASVATALLNISLDISDKMAEELKTYGANILVIPKERSLPFEIEGIDFNPIKNRSFIEEKYLENLRMIFWRYNIKGFAPHLTGTGEVNNHKFVIDGTWFEKNNTISTGETFVEGIKKTRPYLAVKGEWIDDESDYSAALVNEAAEKALSLKPGEPVKIVIYGPDGLIDSELYVKGIVKGDDQNIKKFYVPLKFLQEKMNLTGHVQEVEVSALTTPNNKLSDHASEDPDSLTSAEFEKWYCTAYVSSVAFQIEEAIPTVCAKPIRKVAEAEGNILTRLKILMFILTAFAMIMAGLGIWSLMTTSVLERTREIGLSKALGADSFRIAGAFIAEVVIISICGSLLGYAAGFLFCQVIARSVFGYGVSIKPIVLPVVFFLSTCIAIIGSLSPIKFILALRPIEVLHEQ